MKRRCLQLFVDRVPGTAKDLTQTPFPVVAVLRSVHAGQPRSPAPGRAVNWHGPQWAALCLVSRTSGVVPPWW